MVKMQAFFVLFSSLFLWSLYWMPTPINLYLRTNSACVWPGIPYKAKVLYRTLKSSVRCFIYTCICYKDSIWFYLKQLHTPLLNLAVEKGPSTVEFIGRGWMKGHWHQWRDIYHTANRCAHWTCAALTFRGTPGHSHIDHTENTVSGHT